MIQARESKAGVQCQDVARAVHQFQVDNGMAPYIFHRPAHGQGIEGHQPPYIALGDETVLQTGMMFDREPGTSMEISNNGFYVFDIQYTDGTSDITWLLKTDPDYMI